MRKSNNLLSFILVVFFFVLASDAFPFGAKKQDKKAPSKKHQIVIQLTSEDTLVHKSVFRQIKNVLSLSPESQIEVVCHGPGLFLLVKSKTHYLAELEALMAKGIVFAACEFAMKNYKITPDLLVAGAVPVPSGVIEIIEKQEAGWSYLKAGF